MMEDSIITCRTKGGDGEQTHLCSKWNSNPRTYRICSAYSPALLLKQIYTSNFLEDNSDEKMCTHTEMFGAIPFALGN
jgi:hypothetical protein